MTVLLKNIYIFIYGDCSIRVIDVLAKENSSGESEGV